MPLPQTPRNSTGRANPEINQSTSRQLESVEGRVLTMQEASGDHPHKTVRPNPNCCAGMTSEVFKAQSWALKAIANQLQEDCGWKTKAELV